MPAHLEEHTLPVPLQVNRSGSTDFTAKGRGGAHPSTATPALLKGHRHVGPASEQVPSHGVDKSVRSPTSGSTKSSSSRLKQQKVTFRLNETASLLICNHIESVHVQRVIYDYNIKV